MTEYNIDDKLHRLAKRALDVGTAETIDEAMELFAGYRLRLVIGSAEAADPHHQAALLTAVALAKRVFLGGVIVDGDLNQQQLTPLPLGPTLADAVTTLGGRIESCSDEMPLISFDIQSIAKEGQFHIRPVFAGWRGGIVPARSNVTIAPAPVMPLAPMVAAALAVNEAFMFVSGDFGPSGRRPVGISLWAPNVAQDWLARDDSEPVVSLLPTRLWLIGLGHLGQAYLWALGLLPYQDPKQLSLVLQDIDIITPSTGSTSILSDADLVGQKKTRAMAAWAEQRGFNTAIQERRFDGFCKRQAEEPAIALCGLDNVIGRQALDTAGFDFAVEAGLGSGHQDFRAIQVHTLPASRPAKDIWKSSIQSEDATMKPAYRRMIERGELDRCGVTLLAGKAVGAPFVGATAATLVISEVLRLLHGGTISELIDLDLTDVDYRTATSNPRDFAALNPGYTEAK